MPVGVPPPPLNIGLSFYTTYNFLSRPGSGLYKHIVFSVIAKSCQLPTFSVFLFLWLDFCDVDICLCLDYSSSYLFWLVVLDLCFDPLFWIINGSLLSPVCYTDSAWLLTYCLNNYPQINHINEDLILKLHLCWDLKCIFRNTPYSVIWEIHGMDLHRNLPLNLS